ncbi:protein FAR1-RELATED SEQUENCE 3-like [Spinacia oleracea]|uniref:Protein FAR1-RELATED SEQUENCE n=1 Tax=Spinacia oleracea TaxID=3562 RepID=A0ABM3RQW8_SPIOL|nr:protein FAR1-RELATED SEQUENCE 3-like [Spinacia oleracea]
MLNYCKIEINKGCLVGEFAVERKFQKLYTDAKFLEVQKQCMREVEHTVSEKVWIWSKYLKKEISLGGRKRIYVVLFNKKTSFAKCECNHFECHVIVCRHIINVLYVENVETVPSGYIVDHWRKDIQRKHTLVKVACHDPEKTDEVKRYDKIMNATEPATLRGSISEQKLDMVIEGIMNIVLRLDESDVVTTVVGDNQGGGPSSVGNRKASDGPTTPGFVNKPPKSIGDTPTPTPTVIIKDPDTRGGVKAHRTRDKRFLQPGENKKPAKKQVRKTKNVVDDDNPEPSIYQNRGPMSVHPQNNYVHPQIPFTPGWGGHNRYVSNVAADPQQHEGVVRGSMIYPEQNYNNGVPVQHYQSSSSRVGGGVATNLFPLGWDSYES